MILVFWFTLTALLTWRLASLLARERGPFGLMTYLRRCFGVAHEADGSPAWEDGDVLLNTVTHWASVDAVLWEVGRGLTCVWCNSIWIAFLVGAPLAGSICPVLTFTLQTTVLTTFALSAAAILIDRCVIREDG